MMHHNFKVGDKVCVKSDVDRSGTDCFNALVGIPAIIKRIDKDDTQIGVDYFESLKDANFKREYEDYSETRDDKFHELGFTLSTPTGWFINCDFLKHYKEDPIMKFFDKHPLEK
jgi:hypothetical protein